MSDKTKNVVDWDDYPIILELRFKTKEQKELFIDGFLDGWGEDAPIQRNWDWPNNEISKMSVEELEDET